MNKDEALRLALEALEYMDVTAERYVDKQIPEKAIACLRLVIDAENISSKPMAWEQFYPEMGKPKLVEVQDGGCKHCTDGCPACDARKLPEQEPVTWRNAAIRVGEDLCSVGPFRYYDMTAEQWLDWALSVVTVHAPPPQRTWVGLTNEELSQIEGTHLGRSFAKAIEAKLKEKNS
jgi:hypothetical protein